MTLIIIIFILVLLIGITSLSTLIFPKKSIYDTASWQTWVISIVTILYAIFTLVALLTSWIGVSKGEAVISRSVFGGAYNKTYKKLGLHYISTFAHYERIDIRNTSQVVPIKTVRQNQYNISGAVHIIYDLNPDKLENLYNTYDDYKTNIIISKVQIYLNNDSSFTNEGKLTEADKEHIEKLLKPYGILITNIYISEYSNTNNYQLQTHHKSN